MNYPYEELNKMLLELPVDVQDYIVSDDVSNELDSVIDIFGVKPENEEEFRKSFYLVLLTKWSTSDFTDYLEHELHFSEEDAEEIMIYLDDVMNKTWGIIEKIHNQISSPQALASQPVASQTPVQPKLITPQQPIAPAKQVPPAPVEVHDSSEHPVPLIPKPQAQQIQITKIPSSTPVQPSQTSSPMQAPKPVSQLAPQPSSQAPTQPQPTAPTSMLDKKLSAPTNLPPEEIVWGKPENQPPKKTGYDTADPYREPPTA